MLSQAEARREPAAAGRRAAHVLAHSVHSEQETAPSKVSDLHGLQEKQPSRTVLPADVNLPVVDSLVT
jgi:hypothetical protein